MNIYDYCGTIMFLSEPAAPAPSALPDLSLLLGVELVTAALKLPNGGAPAKLLPYRYLALPPRPTGFLGLAVCGRLWLFGRR